MPGYLLRFLLLLFPLSAQAAEAAGTSVAFSTYLQAALALSLILAILFATAWMARKVSGGKGFGQGDMKILGGVALGPRERIVLVEIGEDWLVIGIVPGQIRTLHRLAKGSSPRPEEPADGTDKPFAHWLKTIAERGSNGA